MLLTKPNQEEQCFWTSVVLSLTKKREREREKKDAPFTPPPNCRSSSYGDLLISGLTGNYTYCGDTDISNNQYFQNFIDDEKIKKSVLCLP